MLARNEESFASVITVACYSIFYFPPTHSLLSPLSISLCRCLRAFCSWLVVCALLCHCICVSLGYAKSITRHNRISYGGTPPPLVSVSVSFSVPFPFSLSTPFPFPVSVVLEFFNLICSTDFRSFKTCFCFCYCFFFALCMRVCECVCICICLASFLLL